MALVEAPGGAVEAEHRIVPHEFEHVAGVQCSDPLIGQADG